MSDQDALKIRLGTTAWVGLLKQQGGPASLESGGRRTQGVENIGRSLTACGDRKHRHTSAARTMHDTEHRPRPQRRTINGLPLPPGYLARRGRWRLGPSFSDGRSRKWRRPGSAVPQGERSRRGSPSGRVGRVRESFSRFRIFVLGVAPGRIGSRPAAASQCDYLKYRSRGTGSHR